MKAAFISRVAAVIGAVAPMPALGAASAASTSSASSTASTASTSSDWTFEGGLQVGVVDRRLGTATFRPTMNAQPYAEWAVWPKRISVGAYFNGYPAGNRAFPDRLDAPEVDITAIGLRARAFAPIDARLVPYAVVGVGRLVADFPQYRDAPKTTKYGAELPLGVGLRFAAEGPFVMSLEAAYRPVIGYSNDAFDGAFGGQVRGTHAWTLHFGLALAL